MAERVPPHKRSYAGLRARWRAERAAREAPGPTWHDAVADVLMEECGWRADPADRREFLHHFPGCREFRFIGSLGFGGKVWSDSGRLYVTCYQEDRTPEREAAIKRANARLQAINNASPSEPLG